MFVKRTVCKAVGGELQTRLLVEMTLCCLVCSMAHAGGLPKEPELG